MTVTDNYEPETGKEKKLPYPKSIIFIIGNEFCERFSYYGMKAILVLYFRYIMEYTDNSATQAYHIFSMACYFTPVLGAIIADSFLGKFWTILSISIVYAAGNVLLSFASIQGTAALTFLGLGLIALGTGGIKPCVSAFGGDQFDQEKQQTELQKFFSWFYVSINAGSLISTFLTPILRQDVSCNGRSDCYPLAFGVPAVLMVAALVLFIVGKFITNYVMVPPQKDNVVVMVCKCVFHALSRKMFSKAERKEHWLDYAEDQYTSNTIKDVKALMGVLFLYLPLPIFWALFDQQGSRWTLQATRMNGKLGGFTIKPDQIQVINPLLIILMIPLFNYVVYPALGKVKLNRPLQRMTIGGILAGVAFFICAFFQLKIETEQPVKMLGGYNHVGLINSLNCQVEYDGKLIPPYGANYWENIERAKLTTFSGDFRVSKGNSSDCTIAEATYTVSNKAFTLVNDEGLVLVISDRIVQGNLDAVVFPNFLSKPSEGGALMFTAFALSNYKFDNFSITETNDELVHEELSTTAGGISLGFVHKFEVEVKGKDVSMSVGTDTRKHEQILSLDQGATYFLLVHGDMTGEKNNVKFELVNIVDKNQLSVFLQVIQYLVITCAEIMFSVTGLEFSYSQAPKSMKAVLQAAWLLTVAFGNLIVAIIADLKIFPEQSHEFFFFGGLMIVDICLFALMAYYYVPVQPDTKEEEEEDQVVHNGNGKEKPAQWED